MDRGQRYGTGGCFPVVGNPDRRLAIFRFIKIKAQGESGFRSDSPFLFGTTLPITLFSAGKFKGLIINYIES